MKKLFSFLMVVFVVVSAFWFTAGSASASGNFVVYIPGVTKQDVKNASMFAGSEYQNIYCVLKDEDTGKVVCNIPGKYAGQDVTIYVANHVYSFHIPEARTEETVTCTPPEVLGAMVLMSPVTRFTPTSYTVFVAGDTLQAVSDTISSWGGGYYTLEIVSGLQCGIEEVG